DETFNVSGIEKQNVINWTYGLNNRQIKEVFDHYDDSLDQTLFFEYDRVGNRLQQQVDKKNDGTIDDCHLRRTFSEKSQRLIRNSVMMTGFVFSIDTCKQGQIGEYANMTFAEKRRLPTW
ncbi:MAG: hypothetical protein LBC20_10610, partial [Planctomycetaceae bacterium]|nr:hypothetical protein [Planctomycetaceae bacterium]